MRLCILCQGLGAHPFLSGKQDTKRAQSRLRTKRSPRTFVLQAPHQAFLKNRQVWFHSLARKRANGFALQPRVGSDGTYRMFHMTSGLQQWREGRTRARPSWGTSSRVFFGRERGDCKIQVKLEVRIQSSPHKHCGLLPSSHSPVRHFAERSHLVALRTFVPFDGLVRRCLREVRASPLCLFHLARCFQSACVG